MAAKKISQANKSSTAPAKKIFIFGFGYSAAAVARRLMAEGWKVAATSRDVLKRQEMQRLGIEAFDFPDAAIPQALATAQALLVTFPPGKQGDPALLHYREAITAQRWEWVGVFSTTGVYGDHQGAWVDETTPLPERPSTRIQHRIEAENAWKKAINGDVLRIFRLAGIYGPGKIRPPHQAIYKEGQFFSRIHVEDIAGAVWCSLQNSKSGIYNLSDNEPAASHEVVAFTAKTLGFPAPEMIPYAEAQLEGMAAEFWQNNRRVSNRKLREELGYTLKYPTYREGVQGSI